MNTKTETDQNEQATVLVPWDFSSSSKAALKFAQKRFASGDIRVLCVLEQPNPYAMGFQWNADAEKTAVRECAEDFVDESGLHGAEEIQFHCRFGDPADEIVRFANERQAEFIVMSTRGRTGLQKLFLGSVAQRVTAHASCPIILLPAKWPGFVEEVIA